MDSATRPQRTHKKSRLGCLNCKARKIKCDERYPLCGNCEKHYVNLARCDWPVTKSLGSSTLAVQSSEQLRVLAPSLSQGNIDPFFAYPSSELAGVDILIKYYLSTFVHQCFPFFNALTLINQWWFFVRDDFVLFHVVLELSASHLPSRYSNADRPMNVAIQHLKTRMDDPLQRASDGSIAAVAILASIEHENRNLMASDFHKQALSKQVSIRGGLDAIVESSELVASLVFWTNMTTDNDPMYPELTFHQAHMLDWHVLTISDPLRFNFGSLDEHYRLQSLMSAVDNLSIRFSQLNTANVSADDYISTIISVELTLQALLAYSPPPSGNLAHYYLATCCSYAAVLHIFNPIGGYYPESRLFTNAIMHKLKAALSYAAKIADPQNLLKLWLLSNGAIAAKGLPEWPWFLAQLEKVIKQLDIRSWVRMRQCLSQVIWHAIFCEKTFESLWSAVEERIS